MAIDLSTLSAREAITAIYIGYYDRAADPVGLAFWEDVVDMTSLDLVAITSDFAGQDETLALFPFFADPSSTTPSAFITQLYLNLFNREPDAAGLQFWSDALQDAVDGVEGAISVGEIITAIIEGAQGDDATIIMNKIEVALDWTDSLNASGVAFDLEGETGASARAIIDGVDETEASVVTAKSATDAFIASIDPGVPGKTIILEETRDNVAGTEGNDTFEAFNGELQDGDRIDGGSGKDVLWYFNSEDGVAKSPITTSVEQVVVTNQMNDLNSVADNNVGGYSTNFGDYLAGNIPLDGTIEVDVEIDGGLMNGVTRWEDFDSRADLVIEDARDQDDTDGTFTGDITVAMVSTDPGNVDFAVYFDEPVNTSQNFGTLEIRVLDQEAAFGLPAPSASSTGYLTESSLIEFTFAFDGQPITVVLADEEGVTYGADVSFQDLLDQVEAATQQALVDAGVTENLGFTASLGAPVSVGVGNQFTLPLILTFDVPADVITASTDDIIVTGRDSGNNEATDTFGAISTVRITQEELIRLNVELDDVGKGSMGGDAMFGAMSTGRQFGDDGTSDSIGIQQFDIEVDRSSQLQTINSTNNALEVVNITNGENDGPNNTTTAADEMIGDLVVRGQANPIDGGLLGGVATDGPMPGAVPQHNIFGFSDVRVINAAAMIGSVDLTAELTEEIVEKYLDIQDDADNGNADDVVFDYDLGTNNDEFLLNMSADALNSAGTGSREDFQLDIDGNGGDDVITTNVGGSDTNFADIFGLTVGTFANGAAKVIDEQGQDYYALSSTNDEDWYENTVFNGAASFSVDGGAGNDTIWTHGWGNFDIADGSGMDVVYTDNSGVVNLDNAATNIDRNLTEHDQIDYALGSVWVFNGESADVPITGTGQNFGDLSGITNDTFAIATGGAAITNFTGGTATVAVAFNGLSATAAEAYVDTASITLAAGNYNSTTGTVSIDEQTMNQAIKEAINTSPVLSAVLEAVDGPGNSLIVYSKIDGSVLDATTLEVTIASASVNGAGALTPVAAYNTAYTAEGYENFAAAGTPTGDSVAESDNTIDVAGDGQMDVFVLSTNDGNGDTQPTGNVGTLAATELNGASNETLVFNSGFGVDTVFNFDAAAAVTAPDGIQNGAEDVLDFSQITGVANSLAVVFSTGPAPAGTGDVVIDTIAAVEAVLGTSVDGNLTAAEVLAYFAADDTNASEHILIAYDDTGDNGGNVWSISDGAAAADATATEEGTINLIGTAWTAIADDNIA